MEQLAVCFEIVQLLNVLKDMLLSTECKSDEQLSVMKIICLISHIRLNENLQL